jgi:hypothetical protein
MRPPRPILLLLLLVGILALALPVGVAAPPPADACSVCHTLETRETTTVVESDLTVRVKATSASTWTSRVTVDDATATRLAENRTRLAALVTDSFRDSPRTVVDDPQNVSYTLDGQTLRVRYTVPETVQSGRAGVVLFTGFRAGPGESRVAVNADRLVVRGRSGQAVTHAPGGGTVDGEQVRWQRQDGGTLDGVVAFADADGPLGQATTAVSLREHRLAELGPGVVAFGALPALVLGLGSLGLLVVESRFRFGDRVQTAGFARAVLGGLVAGSIGYVGLLGLLSWLGSSLLWLPLVLGVLLLGPVVLTGTVLVVLANLPAFFEQTAVTLDERRGKISTLAAATVAVWTLVLVIGGPLSAPLVLLCSPLAFLPFGILAGANHWARWLLPPVTALGALVAAVPFAQQSGLRFVSPGVLTLALTVSGLLGAFLFVLGCDLTGLSEPTTDHPG